MKLLAASFLFIAIMHLLSMNKSYSQTTGINDTPENLGKTLFRAFTDSNFTKYKNHFPSQEDIQKVFSESKLQDEEKELQTGIYNYGMRVLNAHYEGILKNMYNALKKLEVNVKELKYDSIRVKTRVEDGLNAASVVFIFNIKGEKHELRFNDFINSGNGWTLINFPETSASDTLKAREKRKFKLIKPEVIKYSAQSTTGFPNRIIISAESNVKCNWNLTLTDKDGKLTGKLQSKTSIKPQWVFTFNNHGEYNIKITVDDSLQRNERKEKIIIAKSLTGKEVMAWTLSASDRENFYRTNFPDKLSSSEINLTMKETEAIQVAYTLSFNSKVNISFDNPYFNYNVFRVGYLDCRRWGPFDKQNFIPDALAQMNNFNVNKGDIEGLYLEFKAKPGVKPGKYKGNIILSFDGLQKKIPLNIRLFNIELPDELPIKTAFSAYFVSKDLYADNDRMYDSVLHRLYEHHITPDLLYRSKDPLTIDDVKHFVKLTGNSTFSNIFYIYEGNVATWEEKLPKIKPVVDYIKTNKLEEQFYFYIFDESRTYESYKQMKQASARLKELFPEIKIMTTATIFRYKGFREKLPNVDYWCPLTRDFEDFKLNSSIYSWWYICVGPHPPYANWFVESDLVEARILWWQSWQYNIKGFLYYASNRWPGAKRVIYDADFPLLQFNPATFENANGDGNLMYPGEKDILPSLRLKNIRDGIDDMALLKLAENKLGRETTIKYTQRISRSLNNFDHDAAKMLEVRRELLITLDRKN